MSAYDTAEEIAHEQVRALYAQSPGGLIVTLIAGCAFGLLLSIRLPLSHTIAWWIFWLAVLLGRTLLWRAYCQTQPDIGRWRVWRWRFVVGSVLAGFAWGVGAYIGLVHFANEYVYFILFTTGAMSVVSVAYLSSVLVAYAGFLLAVNLPVFVWLLTSGERLNVLLAFFVVLFVLGLSRVAMIFNASLFTSLRLLLENRHLTRDLEDSNKKLLTDIRETERLLGELEQKNAELEQFAYTISHDLKGPLVTIRSFAGLLGKDLDANDEPRLRADIGRILQASAQMQSRLQNLLELAKIGHQLQRGDGVDLNRVVRSALDLLHAQVEISHANVRIDSDLPVITADEARIVEVYQNLLENALKFANDDAPPDIHVGCRRDDDEWTFFVNDNGIGLEQRFCEKIFDLFETLAEKNSASGVGLAIVRRIVEAHGGRVWAQSEGLGLGTAFLFTLPQSGYN